MKITVLRKEFVAALTKMSKVIDNKTRMPILTHVCLTTKGTTQVVVAGTNLQSFASLEVTASVYEGGTVWLPAKDTLALCKASKVEEVVITHRPATNVKCSTVPMDAMREAQPLKGAKIISATDECVTVSLPEGTSEKFLEIAETQSTKVEEIPMPAFTMIELGPVQHTVTGLDEGLDLKVEVEDNFSTLDYTNFSAMVAKTIGASGTDSTRKFLNGALLTNVAGPNGQSLFRMVCCDGHRLHIADCGRQQSTILELPEQGIIVPRDALLIADTFFKKLLYGCVEIAFCMIPEKQVAPKPATKTEPVKVPWLCIRSHGQTLVVKCYDEQFPHYEQVIPKANYQKATVVRKALLSALDAISPVVKAGRTKGVVLELTQGKMTLTAENDSSTAKQEIIAAYEATSDLRIGVNASYLVDALEESTEIEVSLLFGDELTPVLTPVLIQEPNYTRVIMPMRL